MAVLCTNDSIGGCAGVRDLNVVVVRLLTVVIHIFDKSEDGRVVVSILWLDELGPNVGVNSIVPIVLPCLVEQSQILCTGVHLAPAHTANVGVHATDTVIVVVAWEFGIDALDHENILGVLFW